MTKIIFITSGKIRYRLGKLSLYKSIERAAAGLEFPHIAKNSKKEILDVVKLLGKDKPSIVYSAPSHQAKETADIIAKNLGLKIVMSKSLLPLRFNLKGLLSEKEFYSLRDERFNTLRERFLNAFFENNLIDKNYEVKRRFEDLRKHILRNYQGKTLIAVSHSYLIKLFSIYYKIGHEMFGDKKKLFELFRPSKEPLGRLQTMEINL